MHIETVNLATGPALAQRLTTLIPALQAGQIPRSAGLAIRQGLDRAELQLRRQGALQAILGAIDPDRALRACGVAQRRLLTTWRALTVHPCGAFSPAHGNRPGWNRC